MKISNERLINDYPALSKIANKELPIKASYAIAKNLAKIESEIKIYEKERNKLIEKYAEKDDEGKVKADESGQIAFIDSKGWAKDIKDLLTIENEIDMHKFSIEAFGDCNISASELMLIDYMIEG